MSDITVTGWGKDAGPAYSVSRSVLDRKRMRRSQSIDVVRKQHGKSYEGSDHAVVSVDNLFYLMLNKGYSYNVKMDYGGVEIDGSVDATETYAVIPIGDDEKVLSVSSDAPVDSSDDVEALS